VSRVTGVRHSLLCSVALESQEPQLNHTEGWILKLTKDGQMGFDDKIENTYSLLDATTGIKTEHKKRKNFMGNKKNIIRSY